MALHRRVTAPAEAKNAGILAMERDDAFLVTTGRMPLAVAGHFRLTFRNPSPRKKIIITRIVAFNTASAAAYATVFLNPTVNVPTSAILPPQSIVFKAGNDNLDSVVEMRADTSTTDAMGAGTGVQKFTMAVPGGGGAGVRNIYDGPFVIAPLVTMGITVQFAGAADVVFTVYYYEEGI